MLDLSKLTVDDEITDSIGETHTYWLYPVDWTLGYFESQEYYEERYGKVVCMCIEKWTLPNGLVRLLVSPSCEWKDPFFGTSRYSDVDWSDLDLNMLDDNARKFFGV